MHAGPLWLFGCVHHYYVFSFMEKIFVYGVLELCVGEDCQFQDNTPRSFPFGFIPLAFISTIEPTSTKSYQCSCHCINPNYGARQPCRSSGSLEVQNPRLLPKCCYHLCCSPDDVKNNGPASSFFTNTSKTHRVPPNVRFEIDDVEAGWTYNQNFDYIHCRFMGNAIRNWSQLVDQCFE